MPRKQDEPLQWHETRITALRRGEGGALLECDAERCGSSVFVIVSLSSGPEYKCVKCGKWVEARPR